ncbi:ribosomal protection-like ABC-F family protein [Fictibacillus sp. FJAT-27399]|uniref:ribosomal protection-like ABC-F family protein n=1 Tax=Fictibacillus sp. FJAT-27399 TaxID=1729689 RepID=UPI0007826EDA|nr:ABC-F type ribosomal protection protein [Fictibacillus sp. FJAT-27399]
MTLLSCHELSKEFGERLILKEVSLNIDCNERIGLVGVNGAGKTTLANLIFGTLQPGKGSIVKHKNPLKIGYLQQSTSYTTNTFSHMQSEEEDFLQMTSRLGLKKVQNWDESRFSGLSGGERTKLAIAHIWSTRPDLLILDEPTNHLDFKGVEWLIQELRSFIGTTLIISHDRYFLDQTVNRIIELDDGKSVDFPGNYSFYREEKERRHHAQLNQYETQKKYEQKIQSEIERLDNWSSKAHREAGKVGKMADMRGTKEFYRSKAKSMDKQISSRIKRLKKIELEGVEKPKEETKIQFGWDNPEKRGKRLVDAKEISKSFSSRPLFQKSSFYIKRGERLGLTGPNGCGKTTLLKMLTGRETVDSGELWISSSAKMAYLTQDVTDLPSEQTVVNLIHDVFEVRSEASTARTLLANMGFDERMLKKQIHQLSLGERMRVKLALLIMQKHDLLILDEPTNHLDLASREQLEEALLSFSGTLLIVSHDRYFLEKTCEKLLVFEDGNIRKTQKGFKEFAEAKQKPVQPQNHKKTDLLEKRMIIENRISAVLGELSLLSPGDKEYTRLDQEFKRLMEEKRKLS